LKIVNNKIDELLANVGDMALKRRARRIIQVLEPKRGDKILDLGCGNGYYSYLLSKLSIKLNITGIDNHINALQDAKIFVGSQKAKFIFANAERIPFPKNYFDKIVMSEIIEHVNDDLKVLKEVRRVLKPGGIVVLTTPNKDYPFFWDPVNWILLHFFDTHIKSGFFAGIWNQHLRLYKPRNLEAKMKEAGFKTVSYELLTGWSLPFNHYLLNIGARILYYKKLNEDILQDINKFSISKNKKTKLASFLFWLVNSFDKLNDIFPNSSGVSILVTAFKN
jgi:ubiquinone/menaquinone biosynthesis C-methylase UbiE